MSSAPDTAVEPAAIDAHRFGCHPSFDRGAARLCLEGELDIAGESRFAWCLERCQAEAAVVVVDLRALAFMSCGGLRHLLNAARHARATGGRLVVVRGQAAVERLFDLIGVSPELELVDRPPEPPRLHSTSSQ